MKIYQDKGFIIRTKQFLGADKLVVFLTEGNGIVESVAKGVSKSSSKIVSSIDLLNYVKVSFYRTKGLDLLREVVIMDDYQILKRSNEISKNLLYILELIDKLVTSSEYTFKIYNLLFEFLDLSKKHIDLFELILTSFELKLLDLTGFSPQLTYYTDTNEVISQKESRSLATSQVLGYVRTTTNSPKMSISDRIIKTQRYLLEHNIRQGIKLKVDKNLIDDLQSINRYWIENVTEKKLKSTALLNDTKREF